MFFKKHRKIMILDKDRKDVFSDLVAFTTVFHDHLKYWEDELTTFSF